MRITIHIERLHLDGVALNHADGHLIRAAIETELTRLLATEGLSRELSAGAALPHLRAPDITIERKPAAIGNSVASAVHASLARNGGKRHG